ncbi:MAG: PD40 domain-containing protein [Anaerolineae bacterium]|nr:PD40 domain-containing protein [Anaerolineae bacterium]
MRKTKSLPLTGTATFDQKGTRSATETSQSYTESLKNFSAILCGFSAFLCGIKIPGSIRLGLACVVALLWVGMILTPSTAAQEDDTRQLTVIAPALNVRSGPGVTYPALAVLNQGDQVTAISHDASGWWQVRLSEGGTGWVSGGPAYVSLTTPLSAVAAVAPTVSGPVNFQNPGTLVFQTVSGGPIYAIGADGSNLHYLTTGMDPALSPDGQWVAFTRWDNPQIGARGSLWVINVDGSGERRVAENIFQPKSPTWSPDGTQIILSMTYGEHLATERKCSGERPPRSATDIEVKIEGKDDIVYCYTLLPNPYWGLRRVNVITGQSEDLNYDTHSVSPAWDPANPQRLVYDGQWGLVSLDLGQGVTSPLTTDVQHHSPIFSPDGSKLAVSYRQDDHWEIHVLNADGSGNVRLTETSYLTWAQQELSGQRPYSYNNAAPAWSPDGSQIAFLTDRSGQWEIWVMNADGSSQRPLFPAELLTGMSLQYNGVDERVLSWR